MAIGGDLRAGCSFRSLECCFLVPYCGQGGTDESWRVTGRRALSASPIALRGGRPAVSVVSICSWADSEPFAPH